MSVHVLALVALIFSFDWNIDEELEPVNIIQATAVDESKIANQIKNLKKIEARKKHEQDMRLAKLAKEAQQARRDRERQQQKLEELQKKNQITKQQRQQYQSEADKAQQKLKEEKQKLEEAKIEENIAKQLRDYDMARIRADKSREAKRDHKNRSAKEIAEIEKQLREEEQSFEAPVEAPKTIVNDPNQEVAASEIQKFIGQLTALVSRSWRKPPGLAYEQVKDLKCVVRVRLMPTGDVSYVNIIRDCGDARFQRSVETAVKKAAPYPLPEDKSVFDRVREIEFVFIPEAPS